MPFTSGTQGADANCAQTFMATLDTALLAAGYVFVEEVGTGDVARVYRSPAGLNVSGYDWFLFVRRTAANSTTVSFTISEQYNSSTHLVFYYATSLTGRIPVADGSFSDPAGKSPVAASTFKYRTITVSTSSFAYYISATPNRLAVGTRVVTSNYAAYAGLMDDWYQTPLTYPPVVVCAMETETSGTSIGGVTREPGITTNPAGNDNFCVNRVQSWGPVTNPDPYSAGKALMNRAYVRAQAPRGLLRDVWMVPMLGVNGDTVSATIGGSARTLAQITGVNAGAGFGVPFVDMAL